MSYPDASALSKLAHLDPEALNYGIDVLSAKYPNSPKTKETIQDIQSLQVMASSDNGAQAMRAKLQEQEAHLKELNQLIDTFCAQVQAQSDQTSSNAIFEQARIDYKIENGEVLVGVNTNLGYNENVTKIMFDMVNQSGALNAHIQSIDGRMYDTDTLHLAENQRALAHPDQIDQIFKDLKTRLENKGIRTEIYNQSAPEQISQRTLNVEHSKKSGPTFEQEIVAPD
jgi:hypothetical protein